jgi:5-formyltetrahydrofolate cyclo-ligase
MLNISRIDDLVANSMNILEPDPVDTDGNAREDGTCLSLSFVVGFFVFPYCQTLFSYCLNI